MNKIKEFLANNMFFRETSWAFIAKGVAFISFYLILIFLTRTMTVDEWGKWSLFFSLYTVAFQIFNFGMPFSARHFFARYRADGALASVIKSSLKARLILNLCILLVLLALSIPILNWFDRPFLAPLVYLALPATFIYAFVDMLRAGFEGLHRLKNVFYLNLIEHGLKLIFVVSLFTYFRTYTSILYAFIISFLLASIFGIGKLLKSFYRKTPQKDITETITIQRIILYCLPAFGLGFLLFLPGQLGIILINKFHGDYETGIFTAAHQLIKYAPEISVALSMGTMPAFANIDIHNLDHFIKSFKRILYMSSSVYLAIALVFFLLGGLIIDLAFGIKYDASTAVLKLLLPFMIIVGINTLLTALLNYWGKIRQLLISFGISTIIGVTLMFILIPPMGAKGLAIALSAQMIPTLLINTYFIRLKIRAIVANE